MSDSTKEQWNLNAMDAASAWRFNKGSDKVKLVSLDTGLKDEADNPTDVHNEIDHVQNESAKSSNSHGHRSMSVMAAKHDSENLAGIAPGSQLVAYNVWADGVLDSIEDAKDKRDCGERLVFQNGAGFGGSDFTTAEMTASLDETESYAFFAASAGNDGDKTSVAGAGGLAPFQTSHANVASVGALEFTGTEEIDAITGGSITNVTGTQLDADSNAGWNLTLVAPEASKAIDANGTLSTFTKTSCANPNVAGAAAIVWSENLSLTGGEIREILTTSAMDLGATGRDDTYGAGTVNIDSAVRRAHALSVDNELASLYSNTEFLA
ncbi:S8 family serine peptidase [Cyanobacteria bacterium 150SLHB]|nr:Subtilisin BL [Prochlorococcus marinus str. MIT 1327]NMO84294.1 S8 family serine peptidase [Prochlorococcus sp. P1344]